MNEILVQPVSVPVSNGMYRLYCEYEYFWRSADSVHRIIVPTTFKSDGASVPRIAWTLSGIRPDGLIRAAAWIHDYLYYHHGILPSGSHSVYTYSYEKFKASYFGPKYVENKEPEVISHAWNSVLFPYTRKDADRLFLQTMKDAGMSTFKANLAYYSVRLAGWLAWNKHKKRS